MNLHAIVSGAIGRVNPHVRGVHRRSTGSTTQPDGKRVPAYAPGVPVQMQVQALTYKDLVQIAGLNLDGERKAVYVSADLDGESRPDARGGDLLVFPDGSEWLVAQVLENWHDTVGWCKVAVTRQVKR